MARRRESRRRHRETRRARADAGEPPADLAPPAPSLRRAPRDISWTGLIGASLGALFLAQAAVYILIHPGEGSRWLALALFAAAALYLPAVWASVFATAIRQRVQKAVLAVTLALVVAGVLLVDAAFATLLLIPSTLLAIAGGLVFQGGTRAKR